MDLVLKNKLKFLIPCAALGVTGLWFYKKILFWNKTRGMKLPPIYTSGIQLPILGAAVQFLTDPLKMAFRAEKELGDIFTIMVFGMRITFMSGPDAQDAFCKPSDDELSQQEAYRCVVRCVRVSARVKVRVRAGEDVC